MNRAIRITMLFLLAAGRPGRAEAGAIAANCHEPRDDKAVVGQLHPADLEPGAVEVRVKHLHDQGAFLVEIAKGRSERVESWQDVRRVAWEAHRGSPVNIVDDEGRFIESIPRTMVGVVMQPIDEALAVHLRLDPSRVIIVADVLPGLPADQAGLREHDIIVECDGRPVTHDSFRAAIKSRRPGDTLRVRALRAGVERDVTIRLAEYNPIRIAESRGAADLEESLRPAAPLGLTRQTVFTSSTTAPLQLVQPAGADELLTMLRPTMDFSMPAAGLTPDVAARLDRIEGRLEQLDKQMQSLLDALGYFSPGAPGAAGQRFGNRTETE